MTKTSKSKATLKVGVIGLGMGTGHVIGFNAHPRCEVVAVTDLNMDRVNAVADQHNVPGRYSSAEKMFASEKLDIVAVATPNKFHMSLTIMALQNGCHVLCEKPMAMSANEARKMIAASKKARKRLMIDFSYRFKPQSWAIRKQVEAGILGDVYYGRTTWLRRRGIPGFGGWFGIKDLAGGGPLIDLGVHRVDMALWLMGYPQPTYAMGATYDPIASALAKKEGKAFDVEDFAAGFVQFDNGATLAVEASWAGNTKESDTMETMLVGTKGGLRQYNVNEGYNFEAEIYTEHEGCQFDMKVHPPVPDCPTAQVHFADCILNNTPHTATGKEGLIVMEILDALYKSAAQGKPVKIAR